ncbi:hypothetical protein, partial [Klebsiella pneumoniae]|uniref:hypothetical protein n=1 Tax=Klebsiella pneumoniae TaxID=573 RepID=UPI001F4B5D51
MGALAVPRTAGAPEWAGFAAGPARSVPSAVLAWQRADCRLCLSSLPLSPGGVAPSTRGLEFVAEGAV